MNRIGFEGNLNDSWAQLSFLLLSRVLFDADTSHYLVRSYINGILTWRTSVQLVFQLLSLTIFSSVVISNYHASFVQSLSATIYIIYWCIVLPTTGSYLLLTILRILDKKSDRQLQSGRPVRESREITNYVRHSWLDQWMVAVRRLKLSLSCIVVIMTRMITHTHTQWRSRYLPCT